MPFQIFIQYVMSAIILTNRIQWWLSFSPLLLNVPLVTLGNVCIETPFTNLVMSVIWAGLKAVVRRQNSKSYSCARPVVVRGRGWGRHLLATQKQAQTIALVWQCCNQLLKTVWSFLVVWNERELIWYNKLRTTWAMRTGTLLSNQFGLMAKLILGNCSEGSWSCRRLTASKNSEIMMIQTESAATFIWPEVRWNGPTFNMTFAY